MSEESEEPKMKFWQCTRKGCYELFLDSRPLKPSRWVEKWELDDYARCPKCGGMYLRRPSD